MGELWGVLGGLCAKVRKPLPIRCVDLAVVNRLPCRVTRF